MYPPIFNLASKDAAVKAALGTSPTRLYLFGLAPENVAYPYAVWQVVGGSPENYLTNTPDIDNFVIQVDVYGVTAASVRAGALALRNALERHAHVTSWRGESRDAETRAYRSSFDMSFWTNR